MGAPTGFSAVKSGSNIDLSWTNTALSVSSSGGCTAASRIGNYVEKQESGSSTWILMANAGSSATSWSGPPGDGNWKFRVRSGERYYETDDIFTCKQYTSYYSSSESGYFLFGTDTTPDPFDFGIHTTNALLNSYYYSPNTITVAGMSSGASAAISISGTGAQYSKNGGSYTSSADTVQNGDTVRVRILSSSDRGEQITATLSIGSVSDTWSVTTTTDFIATITLPASGTLSFDHIRGAFGPKVPTASSLHEYYKNATYYDGDFTENTTLPESGEISLEDFYGRKGQWRVAQINPVSSTVNYGGTASANLLTTQVGSPEKDLEYSWTVPLIYSGTLVITPSGYGTYSDDNVQLQLSLTSPDTNPALFDQTVLLNVRPKGGSTPEIMSIPVYLRVKSSTE